MSLDINHGPVQRRGRDDVQRQHLAVHLAQRLLVAGGMLPSQPGVGCSRSLPARAALAEQPIALPAQFCQHLLCSRQFGINFASNIEFAWQEVILLEQVKRQRAITSIGIIIQVEGLARAREVIKVAPFLGLADLLVNQIGPALKRRFAFLWPLLIWRGRFPGFGGCWIIHDGFPFSEALLPRS